MQTTTANPSFPVQEEKITRLPLDVATQLRERPIETVFDVEVPICENRSETYDDVDGGCYQDYGQHGLDWLLHSSESDYYSEY